MLALFGFLTLKERDQDTERGEHPGGEIGDRDAGADRSLSRQAGDRHQPAHALGNLVEAGPIGVGTVLAEPRNAGIDQAWIDLRQRLVIDAEALLYVGTEVLDHDIGFLHHSLERRQPFGRFEVERHAALVAMQVLKVGPLARPAHLILDAGGRFDFDDIGAPVGKLPHAGRPRAHPREIEHRETCQSLRSARKGHC